MAPLSGNFEILGKQMQEGAAAAAQAKGIEFVVRKRSAAELEAGGLVREAVQPAPALRRHFNQYRADHAHMKTSAPPFEDESPL